MQGGLPEAMVSIDTGQDFLISLPEKPEGYKAAGIGPGIGTAGHLSNAWAFLRDIPNSLVLDADALNLISKFTRTVEASLAGHHHHTASERIRPYVWKQPR